MKGDVEDILETFNVETGTSVESFPAYYHPGRASTLGSVALLGELHPDYAAEYKFRNRVYLAEIDAAQILETKDHRPIRPIPKFPSIRRDFSLLLSKGIHYSDVEQAIWSVNVPELVRIEPFDRLEAGPFAGSKYALAISLTYQSSERTLTDDEVETFDKAILNSLKQRLGADLRQ
jgi:phenylalanyl-tRNA synthetase beta chain